MLEKLAQIASNPNTPTTSCPNVYHCHGLVTFPSTHEIKQFAYQLQSSITDIYCLRDLGAFRGTKCTVGNVATEPISV